MCVKCGRVCEPNVWTVQRKQKWIVIAYWRPCAVSQAWRCKNYHIHRTKVWRLKEMMMIFPVSTMSCTTPLQKQNRGISYNMFQNNSDLYVGVSVWNWNWTDTSTECNGNFFFIESGKIWLVISTIREYSESYVLKSTTFRLWTVAWYAISTA